VVCYHLVTNFRYYNVVQIIASHHPEGKLTIASENQNPAFSDILCTMMSSSVDCFKLVNSSGFIVDVNDSYSQLLGYTREELIGKHLCEVEAIESVEDVAKHSEQIIREGSLRFETKHLRKDSSPVDVEVTVTYSHLHTGFFSSIVRDISSKKQTEEKLRQSEALYRSIVESQAEFVDRFLPGGILTYVNPALAKFTGFKAEDLLGSSFYPFIHEADRDDCVKLIESISREFPTVEIEGRIIRPDGKVRWTHWSQTGVFDEQGTLIEYQALGKDITEQKLAEIALRESELKYRLLFECAGDSISVMDMQGRFLAVNPLACKMLGYTYDELMALSADKIDARPDEMAANIGKLLENGYYFGETAFIQKNGSIIPISVDARLIVWEEQNAILSICRDITERNQAEQNRIELEKQLLLTQKIESLGVLAGGIAHDFNNILTGIIGNISYARKFIDDSSKASLVLQSAEKAANRASDLSNQLLTFAKGGQPIKEVVAIKHLLQESVSFVLHGSKVSCDIDIPDDILAVDVDYGQISQALNNIIINAIQAMASGGTININVKNIILDESNIIDLLPGKYIKLIIADKGCGISNEDLKKIFDPYFTTKADGSGLGLATTHSIITKHGGYIGVSSIINEGATFEILLPACDSIEDHRIVVPTQKESRGDSGLSVLVMDDEEIIREITQFMLKNLGYHVQTCVDGNEAIAMYKSAENNGKPYSAVIMDLTIPGGMGGKEAAQHILAFDQKASLIVSSGYSNDPVMANYTDFGFSAYLKKPYNEEGLSSALQTGLTAGIE
jgi:two-component system, cell cycle sensor histidine kinase and response regulator CckA